MTADQQDLASRYFALARAMAKPLKQTLPAWSHEIESAATLALVEAARRFNPKRRVAFAVFARCRILGALSRLRFRLIRDKALEPRIWFQSLYCRRNGSKYVLGDLKQPAIGREIEAREFVERMLKSLPSRHASVCRELYLNGLNQLETAELLGYSQSRLSILNQQSLEMLAQSRRAGEFGDVAI